MKKQLEILNSSGKRVPQKFLRELDIWLRPRLKRKLLSRSLKSELKKDLLVLFVNRSQGKKLNFKYRRKNYATDVLSFSPVEESSLGELVFCFEVIAKQAKEHGLSFRKELAYMYIHGVLHLLGFEHEKKPREAKKMYALQDELFESIP